MYKGERFNSYTHLLGAVLAVLGCSILVAFAIPRGDVYRIVGFSIYGVATISLYVISTVYHSTKGPFKNFMQRLDHVSIYLMIAGSYTPLTLITLRGVWGWSIFGVIWGLALIGISQEILLGKKTRRYSLIIYVLMGWLILIAMKPMIAALPTGGLAWLAIGGVLYTGGIGFYVFDEKIRHFHGIWHLFVMGGTAAQYVCLFCYV